MENAPLIGLSRQIALQRQMEVVANNLANINTTGFKAERVLFEDFLMPKASDENFPVADRDLHYTQDWATMHDLQPGAFVQTGGEFDLALNGDGFFAVETPQGVQYTRNGAFHLDGTGTLVTAQGYPVLSELGQITFAANETDITISPQGAILSSAGNKGRIQVTTFDNPQNLVRVGESFFAPRGNDQGQTALFAGVQQGALEQSNVSGVTETADMIRINRAYQLVSQFIERHDELRSGAIRRLGDVNA